MRPGVRTAVVAALGCSLLAAPPAALANDFQKVYDWYKQHGSIRACRFSETQLKNAERETPPDVEQYAPSFLDAVGTAREQSSGCHKPAPAVAPAVPTPTTTAPSAAPTASVPTPAPAAATTTAATPTATTATPTPAPAVPAAATGAPALHAERATRDDPAPVALWLLAGLGALAVVAAIAAAAAWFFGWYPDRWLGPGSRDTARELADWLRFG